MDRIHMGNTLKGYIFLPLFEILSFLFNVPDEVKDNFTFWMFFRSLARRDDGMKEKAFPNLIGLDWIDGFQFSTTYYLTLFLLFCIVARC